MTDQVYIEGQGLVNLTSEEQTTFDARRASDAAWRTEDLRRVRNAKLAETDWTQSRDVTLTNDAAWQTYRQALRDITDTYSDLDSVVWPTKPE